MDSDRILFVQSADKNDDSDNLGSELYSDDREESFNLVDICRICMVTEVQMINLWSSPTEKFDEEFQHIKEVLARFASVIIDENQNLPNVICEKCEANIYFTYTFKRKCENSEDILRKLLNRKAQEEILIEPIVQIPIEEESVVEEQIELDVNINKIEIAYPCNQCSEAFVQRTQLSQHIKMIHKRYQCNECGAHFAQPQVLKRHHKIHLGIKNKLCPICGRCFLRSDDLKRHIRVHTGEKPFKCDKCSKSYKQSSDLVQHKLTHSTVKMFSCKLCGKSMSTRNGYYVHMKAHNGQKNHSCQFCDKKFVTSTERISHMRYIHLKEKLFECTMPECSKRFVTKISLNKHIKIHARKNKHFDPLSNSNLFVRGTADFECHICKKQLLNSQTMKKHLKLHDSTDNTNLQPEKKFVCDICEKKFEINSTLIKHMANHTPFTCELCGVSVLNYETFVLHQEIHNVKEEDDDESSDIVLI